MGTEKIQKSPCLFAPFGGGITQTYRIKSVGVIYMPQIPGAAGGRIAEMSYKMAFLHVKFFAVFPGCFPLIPAQSAVAHFRSEKEALSCARRRLGETKMPHKVVRKDVIITEIAELKGE